MFIRLKFRCFFHFVIIVVIVIVIVVVIIFIIAHTLFPISVTIAMLSIQVSNP